GGPTRTHALLAGSPAINKGLNGSSLAFDQRGPGFARVVGLAADIGAFEVRPPSSSLFVLAPSPAPPQQIVAEAFRPNGPAQARVRDAATGSERALLTPFHGFTGRLRMQLRDLNGDGSLDLIVRALVNGKRKTKAFDARTLAPLPPGRA